MRAGQPTVPDRSDFRERDTLPAPPADNLTDRQRAVLDVIKRHIAEAGIPPTFREIGDAVGIRSTNGVADHIYKLKAKGVIDFEAYASRTIRLVSPPDSTTIEIRTGDRVERLVFKPDQEAAEVAACVGSVVVKQRRKP